MKQLAKLLLAFSIGLSGHIFADDTVRTTERIAPANFSTVKLFFANRLFPEITKDPMVPSNEVPFGLPKTPDGKASEDPFGDNKSSMGGGGMGGMGMMGPPRQYDILRVYIDDEFVTNWIPDFHDVNPVFNLSRGYSRFRIECDGYKTFESKINSIGNGSTQWIVVKLERDTAQSKSVEPALPEKNP